MKDFEELAETKVGTRPGDGTSTDEISLLSFIIAIVRSKWFIFRTMLVTAVLAAAVSMVLPFRYAASTSFLPPQQGGGGSAALLAQLGNLGSVASVAGGLGLKNPNDLQVALLKSQTVEDAMVDRFRLMELYHTKRKSDARKRLEKVVEIDSGSKDGLIRLTVTDSNAQPPAELLIRERGVG